MLTIVPRRVLPALICSALLSAPLGAQVAINEINTGTPDYLELRNMGAATIDISGWVVQTWYATNSGVVDLTPELPFTFPAGTLIPSNGYLVLQEFGSAGAPGTLPHSLSVGFNYFWTDARTIEAALYDDSGTGEDYVYLNWFGNPPAPDLPPGQNWLGELNSGAGDEVRRVQDPDTDHAADWVKTAGAGTPGGPNPGQNTCQFLSLYGDGCPGAGGFVPLTSSDSCPTAGQPVAITISNALGGSVAFVFFSSTQASNPIWASNCNLNLVPVPGASLMVSIGGYGPGKGTVTLLAMAPEGLGDVDIMMQAFIADAAAEIGYSATSGVQLSFQ
ncbi:MAG: lamin tail domain-containing protein [Planctomycetota bacterium]